MKNPLQVILEGLFQQWKETHGEQPYAVSLIKVPLDFNKALPYLCAGSSVKNYTSLLMKLYSEAYPPLKPFINDGYLQVQLLVTVGEMDLEENNHEGHTLAQYLVEKLKNKRSEPLLARGWKELIDSNKGSLAAHGSDVEKEEKYQGMLLDCIAAHKRHPRANLTQLRQIVARKQCCNWKTIERHTPQLKDAIRKLKKD